MKSTYFTIFFILSFSGFYIVLVAYCSINYSIFQTVNSSFPAVLHVEANLTSKNIELPMLAKPPSNC